MSGEVVAVAVGQMVGGQGLNFGIPVEEVKVLLANSAAGGVLKGFQSAPASSLRKNLLVSAAFFGVIALVILGVRRHDRRKAAGHPR
jgi:hypothetical protein